MEVDRKHFPYLTENFSQQTSHHLVGDECVFVLVHVPRIP